MIEKLPDPPFTPPNPPPPDPRLAILINKLNEVIDKVNALDAQVNP